VPDKSRKQKHYVARTLAIISFRSALLVCFEQEQHTKQEEGKARRKKKKKTNVHDLKVQVDRAFSFATNSLTQFEKII